MGDILREVLGAGPTTIYALSVLVLVGTLAGMVWTGVKVLPRLSRTLTKEERVEAEQALPTQHELAGIVERHMAMTRDEVRSLRETSGGFAVDIRGLQVEVSSTAKRLDDISGRMARVESSLDTLPERVVRMMRGSSS